MSQITITNQRQNQNSWEFNVKVTQEGGGNSQHLVTVPRKYYQEISGDDQGPKSLVAESFQFLLDHESPEAILTEFDLPTIENYFPEYPDEVGQ